MILAEASAVEATVTYLLTAVTSLFACSLAGIGWFIRIYLPTRDVHLAEMRKEYHSRLNDQAAQFMNTIMQLHKDNVGAEQVRRSEHAAQVESMQNHYAELTSLLREDLHALTQSVGILTEAVHQWRRAHAGPGSGAMEPKHGHGKGS